MAKRADVPEFGMLRGVTVVNASTVVAGPIAASLMAEMGADVIWIESTKSPDTNRGKGGMGAECDRKNMRNISLDIPSPEGRGDPEEASHQRRYLHRVLQGRHLHQVGPDR